MAKIVQINIKTSFAEGDVNAFVLLEEPITLIDTGIPSADSLRQLKDGLASIGLSLQDLQQVIITHTHLDHSGGVMAIQEEVDVPIFVHERAKSMLNDGKEFYERTEAFMNLFIESSGAADVLNRNRTFREETWRLVHYLSEGDTIEAGGDRFHVLYVPGHSQTDMTLWNPHTGDAFVGDFLLQNISANAFVSPPEQWQQERPKPLLQLRESLNRVRDLPFKTIYPGHGDPYVGHRHLINRRFLEQHERCEEIRRQLQKKPSTIYELSNEMFPWLKGGAVFLGLSELQGHLDLLEERGQVTSVMRENLIVYSNLES